MGVQLGKICRFQSGGTPSKSNPDYFGGSIPWITTTALTGSRISEKEAVEWITEQAIMESAAKIVPANSIMVGTRVGVGKVAINTVEMSTSQDVISLLDIDETRWNKDFVSKFIQRKSVYLNSQARGATIKGIKIESLSNLIVPEIPLKEQILVTNTLDCVLRIIAAYQKQILELNELVKARFVEMFGNPITNDKGWDVAELKSVCDGIGDGLHGTPDYDENGEYPFINGNNLVDGVIEITPATKMVNKDTYMKHYIELADNAVLLSINGTLGKLAFYNGEEVMLGKSACYCNLKPEVNREFVYGVMKTDAFADFLESNATASTIKNVGLKAIRGFKLIIPPQELQIQFVDFSKQVNKLKGAIRKLLDKEQMLFDSLMQQYFG